jgi:tetratricopeptide (TPR) repeat protein
MMHVALVLGVLLLFFCAFYVGKNYHYWKYLLATRNAPAAANTLADKFPGVAAEDLVEQALAAEDAGDWQGAADRLIAAKQKNRAYRGLLFRVGKIFYEKGDLANADSVFENAIQLGENIDMANHYRGLIATARRNLPAAERFFEAAAVAEPLAAEHYYYWGEVLRLAGRPRDAMPRYEQASVRTASEQTRTLYKFKRRIAEIEAGAVDNVAAAAAEKLNAGAAPVDWLMTAAAVAIQQGRPAEGAQLITQAREAKNPGVFSSCAKDMFFGRAGEKHPEIAAACRLEFDPANRPFR